MKCIRALVLGALLAFAPESAFARSYSARSRDEVRTEHSRSYRHYGTRKRDPAQRSKFVHRHPCPGGPDAGSVRRCHGFIVDHIIPLKRGGSDRPSNMQWQTRAEAKAKDKWE
jgi:hypothetical protein